MTVTIKVSARQALARHAVLRLSAPSASVSSPGALGDLSGARSLSSVVRIPVGHGAGTVNVTAWLSADNASTRSASNKITIATATAGSTGSTGGIAGLPSGLSLPGFPGVTTALGAPLSARLPPIAGRQPAVAPAQLPKVEDVSLRTDASQLGLDATSYRLFWTQVAWLTALLVGVCLLLTQARLNRRRLATRAAARRPRRR